MAGDAQCGAGRPARLGWYLPERFAGRFQPVLFTGKPLHFTLRRFFGSIKYLVNAVAIAPEAVSVRALFGQLVSFKAWKILR